jgi:predicted amidophosphoribosyltransferase
MLNRIFSLRCPDCGNKIEEDERYCPHCGTDLDVPVEQATHNPEQQITGKNPSRAIQSFEEAQKAYDDEADFKDALLK